MKFEDWFDQVEVFALRSERFYNDLDHHVEGSQGSTKRMVEWLRAAYDAGCEHSVIMDDGK